jgi:hypothetical protein
LPPPILAFPGSPLAVARRLRQIARDLEQSRDGRYVHVAILGLDGAMRLAEMGRASFVERVGLLAVARDTVLHPSDGEQ